MIHGEVDKHTKRCVGHLTKFGGLQSILGVICIVLSLAALGVDRSDFSRLEMQNQDEIKYVPIGLNIACLVVCLHWNYSMDMLLMLLERYKGVDIFLLDQKVKYMVFSILGASVCVPVVIGSQTTILILRSADEGKLEVLPAMLMAVAVIEFLVAISASVYVSYSPWWGPFGIHRDDKMPSEYKTKNQQKNPIDTISVKYADETNNNPVVETPPPYMYNL